VSLSYGAVASTDQEHPARISYLIDPEGRIAQVYGIVNPDEHPDEVLETLDGLG
jgi:peroxiredoxin